MALAAEVVASDGWSQAKTPPGPPQSQPTSQAAQSASHGRKRAADGELEGEQRLSKRFDLLNLDSKASVPSRLYIPVPGSASPAATSQLPNNTPSKTPTHHHDRRPRPSPSQSDGMQVEETPSLIYIHDLDAELADLSSDEDTPVFLPDIEKHLAKIPKHVLAGPARLLRPTRNNALVLYNVPSSLSVPEEQDRVRRAIVDVRKRIRERQGVEGKEAEHVDGKGQGGGTRRPDATRNGVDVTYEVEEMPGDDDSGNDSDAMDLD